MKHDSSMPNRHRRLLLACCGVFGARAAFGAGMQMDHEMMHADGHRHDAAHEHGHEHQHALPSGITRSQAIVEVPALILVRQDGAKVAFPQELDRGGPVLLDFIYTSCTAICPLTSQILRELQDKLGKDRARLRMVSISIDPEYDTPARLRAYARKFHAGAQWQHYTGTAQASLAMQKAFDVYRGDKMNHGPVTFLRAAPGAAWVRLDGFASPDTLLAEYRALVRGA